MPDGKTYGRVYRMRVLQRQGSTLTVAIPKAIRNRLGLKGGDIVLVSNARGRSIKIRPLSEETEHDKKNSKRQLYEKDE